jgi:molybdopterin/thiamine biosynthesis adenylyltransferase
VLCISAKNVILAGVKSVTLHDQSNVEMWDLSGNFYFTEADIGKNRAVACCNKLQELNVAVTVSTLTSELTEEHLSCFQVPLSWHFCKLSFMNILLLNFVRSTELPLCLSLHLFRVNLG